MSDIKFTCSYCKQSLEAPSDMLGQLIDCPSCQHPIEVRKETISPLASPPPVNNSTIRCPFCSEEILATAVKCKHCGEFLNVPRNRIATTRLQNSTSILEKEIWKGSPSLLYFIKDFIVGVITLPFFGLGIIFIARGILARNTTSYQLTNKRVSAKWGIIARHSSEVELVDIRNISSEQSVMERIFGIGTLEMASAGTDGAEVIFAGIPNHQQVKDTITRHKKTANPMD